MRSYLSLRTMGLKSFKVRPILPSRMGVLLRLVFLFPFHFLLSPLQYYYGLLSPLPMPINYASLPRTFLCLPLLSLNLFDLLLPSIFDTTDCALILRTVL
jgi:hypothetical protein